MNNTITVSEFLFSDVIPILSLVAREHRVDYITADVEGCHRQEDHPPTFYIFLEKKIFLTNFNFILKSIAFRALSLNNDNNKP